MSLLKPECDGGSDPGDDCSSDGLQNNKTMAKYYLLLAKLDSDVFPIT